ASPLVLKLCGIACLADEDRDDVFQDVFVIVHKKLATFQYREAGDSFRGWLARITSNVIKDLYRKRARQPKIDGTLSAADDAMKITPQTLHDEVEKSSLRREMYERALALLRDKFSYRVWQAFWRTTVDGLTAPKAAAELEMSQEAVRKAKSRVLAA